MIKRNLNLLVILVREFRKTVISKVRKQVMKMMKNYLIIEDTNILRLIKRNFMYLKFIFLNTL